MNHQNGKSDARSATAASFVAARLAAKPIDAYPGPQPATLDEGYAIQKAAIAMWPDEIAGWKVGRIIGEAEQRFQCDRLSGPIFRRAILSKKTAPTQFPIFVGGFAAVEAEFIFVISKDAPADKTSWTRAEAKSMIGAVLIGVEIAGSPFAGINDLGPAVTISDFGNNGGLIIGPEFPNWRDFDFENWKCETYIDGKLAGANDAAAIPGGPVESLRFLLENCAQRGMPAKEGWMISTGAVTGVHQIEPGQSARLVFVGFSSIDCAATPAAPVAATSIKREPRLAART